LAPTETSRPTKRSYEAPTMEIYYDATTEETYYVNFDLERSYNNEPTLDRFYDSKTSKRGIKDFSLEDCCQSKSALTLAIMTCNFSMVQLLLNCQRIDLNCKIEVDEKASTYLIYAMTLLDENK
jgi:hypothetical protein